MTINKALQDGIITFTMEGDSEPLYSFDTTALEGDALQVAAEMGCWHMLGDRYAGYQKKAAEAGKHARDWVREQLTTKGVAILSGERVLSGGRGSLPLIGLAMLKADPSATEEDVRAILDELPEVSGTDDEKKEARKARNEVIKGWLEASPILAAAHEAIKAERAIKRAAAKRAEAEGAEAGFSLSAMRTAS